MSITLPGKRSFVWILCGAIGLSAVGPLPGARLSADTLPVTTLPGEPASVWDRIAQRKADKAFEQGDFERAHRVYLKKLAPAGDKHAHYMLGHLNEHGLGVPRDPARALAWYALAAERGSDAVKASAQRLTEELSASEQERADAIFAELLERYGDRRLLVKAIQRDERELRRRTGSRVGSSNKPMLVVSARDGRTISGDQYYQALADRIEFRRQWLGGTVIIGEFELVDTPQDQASEGEEP